MRDPGLDRAIRAAGGVGALARKIGISQPSLSKWSRVPAERVLSVEDITGIDRGLLRPDLYRAADAGVVDETDTARAREYALLSTLLRRAPDSALLARLAMLRGDASPLGIAHAALAKAADATNAERVEREFFDLFIGIGRGELVPYGSYYLTGFLNERPLARLRDDLALLAIERVESEPEPEDHAAVLCEIMAGLAGGGFDAPAGADRDLFGKHLSPWIGRFFADLEQAQAANFYRRLGTIGRLFVEIENEAFALAS
ncbi:MAG: molecular chaperone TorD family protein [Xanthobacteraceae bacterium]|jgi:TorA maturation chaperone TorD